MDSKVILLSSSTFNSLFCSTGSISPISSINSMPPWACVTRPIFGSGTPLSARSLLLPWYIGSWTDPSRGLAISLVSHRSVVPSTSTNFDSSVKGEYSLDCATSSANRAAEVFPTPGGP